MKLSSVVFLAAALPSVALAQLPPFVELRIPKPPTVGTGENGSFLAYELHVTSFMGQQFTVKSIDVMTAAPDRRVLLSVTDSLLARAVARPGVANITAPDRLTLPGGSRGVFFLWVPVDARSAPTAIQHRLTIDVGSGDSVRTQQIEGAVVPVTASAVVIGPPLRGGVC